MKYIALRSHKFANMKVQKSDIFRCIDAPLGVPDLASCRNVSDKAIHRRNKRSQRSSVLLRRIMDIVPDTGLVSMNVGRVDAKISS